MFKQKLADDMASRIADVLAMSPARDIEKNLKAALNGWLAKLDLVTREEFDIQTELLAKAQERMHLLEARLAALENPAQEKTQESSS